MNNPFFGLIDFGIKKCLDATTKEGHPANASPVIHEGKCQIVGCGTKTCNFYHEVKTIE